MTERQILHPFAEALEAWYDLYGRQLPWRDTHDPYNIWISEIILQQTRVAQGMDYYLRFLKRFPDISSLANAEPDEVMQMWEGLGYYSRARNLHSAARILLERYGGSFPQDYKIVHSLPGIGDYTAAAICSFAFGLPHAVVDGNVLRVLARHFGVSDPIDTGVGRRNFTSLADSLLDCNRPALYNQAIMDFGAIVCMPRSPRCDTCPLVESCIAHAEDSVFSLPKKKGRTAIRQRRLAYVIIRQEDHILLHRREEGDIWAGLYEPLLIADSDCDDKERYSNRIASMLSGKQVLEHIEGVKHILTHRHLFLEASLVECNDVNSITIAELPPNCRWVPLSDLEYYAKPKVIATILRKLLSL